MPVTFFTSFPFVQVIVLFFNFTVGAGATVVAGGTGATGAATTG